MLPKFPKFKKLELSDKEAVEKLTANYPAYSDFNFLSMWAWDTHGNAQISVLHENLVVMHSDYLSDAEYFSFFGEHKINQTLDELFDYMEKQSIFSAELRAFPEVFIANIDRKKYSIELDDKNCDYICLLKNLAEYNGQKYANQRKLANKFQRTHKNVQTRFVDLKDPGMIHQISQLEESWTEAKSNDGEYYFLPREHAAMWKMLKSGLDDVLLIGVFLAEKMMGFTVVTLTPNHYAIAHFHKTNRKFEGLNEYLIQAGAKLLLEKKCNYLNMEEDLGHPGIRRWKLSYRPVDILKKYIITKI